MGDIPLDLPSPIRRMIYCWVTEFDRVDAMERTQTIRQSAWFALGWGPLCAQIRKSTPVYVFHILTQTGVYIALPLLLADCDPWRVRTEARVPESHIVTWRRQARPMPPVVRLLFEGDAR